MCVAQLRPHHAVSSPSKHLFTLSLKRFSLSLSLSLLTARASSFNTCPALELKLIPSSSQPNASLPPLCSTAYQDELIRHDSLRKLGLPVCVLSVGVHSLDNILNVHQRDSQYSSSCEGPAAGGRYPQLGTARCRFHSHLQETCKNEAMGCFL